VIGDIFGDNRPCTDQNLRTNGDISNDDCATPDQHPVSQAWRALARRKKPVPGDGNVLVYGAELAQMGGPGEDDVLRVRQAQAATDPGSARDIGVA
jgi:hypothetical protein